MHVGLLDGLRVVDLSCQIAGPYCTKLLADAGADVVKVEPAAGDPLRRWRASGAPDDGSDGALFQFLNTAKRSVVGEPDEPHVAELLDAAEVGVVDERIPTSELARLRSTHPALGIVSITPFGRSGPWADRPTTEYVLQAMCGSIGGRGTPDREPFYAGGRLGEWIAGTFAAVACLAAVRSTKRRGAGEFVDVSMFESMCIFMGGAAALGASLGMPSQPGPPRSIELPSIEPTADGYIGFCTITAQQFRDFLVLIERADLLEDAELATAVGRQRRRSEFLAIVHEWTTKRTSAEIEELAASMRIPVAPIGQPETVDNFEHFIARGVFVPNPGSGFPQPRPPYQVDGCTIPITGRPPRLGEHQGRIAWARGQSGSGLGTASSASPPADSLPLEGLRIVDLTAFWAGPSATLVLASLGAEVIKVESVQRPDGMRFTSAKTADTDHWWEWGSVYLGNNLNKKGVTLDLTRREGLDILLRLVARSDAIIENYSPRVLDHFGLTWEVVREANPRAVMVRMPAFGLSGPWRDRTGFAQTMEQVAGLAWLTGFRDGPPVIPRGPCDPLAGMHAAFALLAALAERDRTGNGHFIESTMVEAALNVAAEMLIEYRAYGAKLTRDGNRGPVAAPQGLYRCAGNEQWLALAIATDDQWEALKAYLGNPAWAQAEDLATARGRRAAHDLLDDHLEAFFGSRPLPSTVADLVALGVPAGPVVEPAAVTDNPQLRARGFVEAFSHPVVGRHELIGLPFRFSSVKGPWFRTASPMLGQHNHEVLEGLLGLSPAEFNSLLDAKVVGDRPVS